MGSAKLARSGVTLAQPCQISVHEWTGEHLPLNMACPSDPGGRLDSSGRIKPSIEGENLKARVGSLELALVVSVLGGSVVNASGPAAFTDCRPLSGVGPETSLKRRP